MAKVEIDIKLRRQIVARKPLPHFRLSFKIEIVSSPFRAHIWSPTKNPHIAVRIAAFLFPPNNIDHRVPNRVIAVLVGVLNGIEEPLPILQRAKLVTLYLVYPTAVNCL